MKVETRVAELVRVIDIRIGDCREVLKTLPDNSVNCCVTSPPYFGLRNYGHADQIGLEDTPEKYIAELVEVFREVKRVLRDDGTLWVNIGDSYSGGGRGGDPKHSKGDNSAENTAPSYKGIPSKNLIGIPWMLAFALRSDGWYLRQDLIWHKPNPMPESVKDRCTKAHEYVFLLSKSQKYYFDAESIKTESKEPEDNRGERGHRKRFPTDKIIGIRGAGTYPKANKRSVWTINTMPYKGAHFATFPLKLVEPCVLAGCPELGTVLDPFGGSGTVGEFCRHHNRNAILIELNPEYKPLIEERTMSASPELSTFCEVV